MPGMINDFQGWLVWLSAIPIHSASAYISGTLRKDRPNTATFRNQSFLVWGGFHLAATKCDIVSILAQQPCWLPVLYRIPRCDTAAFRVGSCYAYARPGQLKPRIGDLSSLKLAVVRTAMKRASITYATNAHILFCGQEAHRIQLLSS